MSDRAQLSEEGSYTSGEEESGSGSYEESESGSNGTEESSEGEEEKEDEPVLKYKRFAKDVVSSISESPSGGKNIICCIAVHPKVGSYHGGLYLE